MTLTTHPIDRKARLALPDQKVPKQDPMTRRLNWEEVCLSFDLRQAQAEASRCLQCPAAPCMRACPLHNDIPGALRFLETGDVLGAAARFRATSPMPEVCGRVCPQERLCEGACVVGKRGVPVHIGHLERFAADYQQTHEGLPGVTVGRSSDRRVAIVGAGPAGLAAAEELRRYGHRVVVFDAWPMPGGLLRHGIPAFKLPPELIKVKIAQLSAAGVTFVGNRRIEGADDFAALRSSGFDAIVLAVGAAVPKQLDVPGEDLNGVCTADAFLARTHPSSHESPSALSSFPASPEPVVVIGGGDTAMDCCRSAIRCGASEVRCLYRRTEGEMPGRLVEQTHAREEGVRFEFCAAPVRILGEDGRVIGVECIRTVSGEPDATGRRRIVTVPNSEFVVPARAVVVAAGYRIDPDLARFAPELARRADGAIEVDPMTGATSVDGVFAAGDVVRGPDLVVTALADGRRVAAGIHSYLTNAAAIGEIAPATGARVSK